MGLSVGVVGLPNVGKSTLFNALTQKQVPAENYPFCTIDPSVGVVPVRDSRLLELANLSRSEKVIPPVVEFVDIAGLVSGAAKGEGLGNQFLAHIREVDAIAHVVRIFDDSDVTHVSGKIHPHEDIATINYELALADLETVEKRLSGIDKDIRGGDKRAAYEKEVLSKVHAHLAEGFPARSLGLNDEEKYMLRDRHLLTLKPVMFVLNTKDGAKTVLDDENTKQEFFSLIKSEGASHVTIDAQFECEFLQMDPIEQEQFRKEMDPNTDGLSTLISRAYALLGLITFFTTGKEETRGWTVKEGSRAPEAGRTIHSDFAEKFIRAEVIFWEDLITAGSYAKARDDGLLRLEGKDYVVKDGDVLIFRI